MFYHRFTTSLYIAGLLVCGCSEPNAEPTGPGSASRPIVAEPGAVTTKAETAAPTEATQTPTAETQTTETETTETQTTETETAANLSTSETFATPTKAVSTMLTAAQAGDAVLLGSCFAEDAPKEFQAFRSGEATAKQIDEFKEFAQDATVGEETIDATKQTATVKVQFKRRAEELRLVKTEAGWKVLDF